MKLSDDIWSYFFRRGANLNEEQRKQLHQWDSGVVKGKRLVELLLRLDRPDTVLAQNISSNTTKSAFLGTRETSDAQSPAEDCSTRPGSDWQSNFPTVFL